MAERRLLAVAALAVGVAAGCSAGHAGTAASGQQQHSVNVAAGVNAGSGAPIGAGPAAQPAGGAGATPVRGAAAGSATGPAGSQGAPASTPSPRPTPTEVPLNARLSSTCVTVGSTMTLSMHAEPNMGVIFDTNYPDGKDGQVHGGFDGRGRTAPDGTYSSTWTVAPGTPIGAADVELAAMGMAYHTGHQRLPFKVAITCS